MESAIILEVVGGGILAVLVLKEVKAIVLYAVQRRNGKNGISGGTRDVYVKQELREVLNEMFNTLHGMQKAIEDSTKANIESNREICRHLEYLTSEINQIKGKVG